MFDPKILDSVVAEIDSLEIDAIKKRLEGLTVGMALDTPIFDPGTFVYRSRKCDSSFNKKIGIKRAALIYPPKDKTRLGRLNREGNPVFYCSGDKESNFFEIQALNEGDELVQTFWKTKRKMLVNNIGYTRHVFDVLGARREVPDWKPVEAEEKQNDIRLAAQEQISQPVVSEEDRKLLLAKDKSRELREALSRFFMQQVNNGNEKIYKLTAAIGEMHLGKIANAEMQMAGVIYPSVRMWGNTDNLALLPWFVDEHLEFRKAVHIRVDSRDGEKISLTRLDFANSFNDEGDLVWLGRMPQWTVPPKEGRQLHFVAGEDEDGDYQISKEGIPCHWKCINPSTGAEDKAA